MGEFQGLFNICLMFITSFHLLELIIKFCIFKLFIYLFNIMIKIMIKINSYNRKIIIKIS